ncbi:hypothetical protein [Loigolactobacillus rennini]|uniref:Uncharacterized protein n=2 Tax=Loigolactobacillus rennini TaxID=238013 RepID=A0A0R2D190_9LACO|nr:hypothetical protein [Loigolactobacillus rennini]KRM97744.1 hypothetical protein FC24_GL001394 [Loigolactobacillus rennini DSM 20253]SFZ88711.1 hypothetical protein LREN565_1824 [Loigolactobacillus rennini]
MRSFSYQGLKNYLSTLEEFSEVEVVVLESPSRYYRVYLNDLQDLKRLTPTAIFNVNCHEIV